MKLLAAIDKSEFTDKVLAEAAKFAKLASAELTVLHVIEIHSDYGYSAGSAEHEEAVKAAKSAVNEKMRAIPGAAAKIEVVTAESPADGILKFVESYRPDVIIMGHRGKTPAERFLLGSVANKIVTYAPCSVYIIR